MSIQEKRALLEPEHPQLSIRRQCEMLGLNRASFYYQNKEENAYNQLLMRLLDEEYTRYPFKGVLRMVVHLKELGHNVNPKRIRRLLRLMGIEAIYPKRNLSLANKLHKKYPYLLDGLDIVQPNQVWCSDVTYIRLKQGFIYLVAVMDWYSRYVLSWRISNSLDASFCIEALQDALLLYGKPEIFNTDQGVQFTSEGHTGLLLSEGIKISMDGKGRAFDNIFIERLWRSVKYEEIYLHDYATVKEAKSGIDTYFKFYNYARPHQALNYKKPAEVYFGIGMPVDYVNNMDNLLVPRKINHIINVGPQAVQLQ